ncbi:MAG TPA: SDR family oxidoreductase [Gammaproteobacteria bacterium]|nr:SDR family oxidoreductase [Gammaproteobacteria bacterium]
MKNAIIISLSSDIALAIADKWSRDGWNMVGTYRNKSDIEQKLNKKITLFHCDLSDAASCDKAAKDILNLMPDWNVLIFATGTLVPLGLFLKNNVDDWNTSIHVNFINQIRLTHRLVNKLSRPLENIMPSVIFFAGGGTNNAVLGYSAYTISKIALIKMCELLDAEIAHVKFTIIGPGWVKTKIHNETLISGEKCHPDNYAKTVERLKNNLWTSLSEVIYFIEWVISQPKEIVGGRNFSVVHDDISNIDFIKKISNTPDMYKLRRCMNEYFIKKDKNEQHHNT